MSREHSQLSEPDNGVDVSVIIPTRNRRALLARALTCALGQEGVLVEVVVVVDGSTDDTDEYLTGVVDDRLIVIRHQIAQGVASARNAGSAAATGRYLAFLDDDDVWAPDKLRAQLDEMAGGCGWSCTAAVVVDERLTPGRPEHTWSSGHVADEMLERNVVPGGASNVVAEAALVRGVGGFDPAFNILADWDLYVRLAQEARLAVVERPLLGYFVHVGSMAHDAPQAMAEFELIRRKYSDERASRGTELAIGPWLGYLSCWALRAGDRRSAVSLRWSLGKIDGRRTRALLMVVLGFVWPGVQAVRDRRAGRRLPPSWRVEMEAWLGPLRTVSSLVVQQVSPAPASSAAVATTRPSLSPASRVGARRRRGGPRASGRR